MGFLGRASAPFFAPSMGALLIKAKWRRSVGCTANECALGRFHPVPGGAGAEPVQEAGKGGVETRQVQSRQCWGGMNCRSPEQRNTGDRTGRGFVCRYWVPAPGRVRCVASRSRSPAAACVGEFCGDGPADSAGPAASLAAQD